MRAPGSPPAAPLVWTTRGCPACLRADSYFPMRAALSATYGESVAFAWFGQHARARGLAVAVVRGCCTTPRRGCESASNFQGWGTKSREKRYLAARSSGARAWPVATSLGLVAQAPTPANADQVSRDGFVQRPRHKPVARSARSCFARPGTLRHERPRSAPPRRTREGSRRMLPLHKRGTQPRWSARSRNRAASRSGLDGGPACRSYCPPWCNVRK